jgi:hypothetical protein
MLRMISKDWVSLVVTSGSGASSPPNSSPPLGEALTQRKLKMINLSSPGRLSRVVSRGVSLRTATFFTAAVSPTQVAEDI